MEFKIAKEEQLEVDHVFELQLHLRTRIIVNFLNSYDDNDDDYVEH